MAYWMQTYTGRKFVLSDPSPRDVCIEDIAHALSLQCRFNGHCRGFYSVADHSLRVSRILSGEHALAGLLHDAAEAYIGDMVRPLKMMMPAFEEVEHKVMAAICGAFGIKWPFSPEVKTADDILLATEARDLMVTPPDDWDLWEDPRKGKIVPLFPQEAEHAFLTRFYSLEGADAAQS